jgi:hypothetical protein
MHANILQADNAPYKLNLKALLELCTVKVVCTVLRGGRGL